MYEAQHRAKGPAQMAHRLDARRCKRARQTPIPAACALTGHNARNVKGAQARTPLPCGAACVCRASTAPPPHLPRGAGECRSPAVALYTYGPPLGQDLEERAALYPHSADRPARVAAVVGIRDEKRTALAQRLVRSVGGSGKALAVAPPGRPSDHRLEIESEETT